MSVRGIAFGSSFVVERASVALGVAGASPPQAYSVGNLDVLLAGTETVIAGWILHEWPFTRWKHTPTTAS
jgi:hypothetical protein